MLIFLDSSVLCADFHLSSTYFELLKSFVEKGGHWICLSEMVLDEVKNKYKEKAVMQFNKTNSELQELNKFLKSAYPILPDDFLCKEIERYNNFLDMIPFEFGLGVGNGYPSISHKEVVRRALDRKKPFKEDGKDGYRDYLIWLAFIKVAQQYSTDEACFITLNTKDFSNAIDKNELHDNLKQDLNDNGIDIARIHYFVSLREFVEQRVKPELQIIEKREELIAKMKADTSGFMFCFDNMLTEKLTNFDLEGYDIFVEEGENPSVTCVEEISDMDITSISEISNVELLLSIRAEALCNVEFFVHKSDYIVMEAHNFSVVDADWNKHYIWAETPMELAVELEVVYNRDTLQIKSMDIESIEDAFADCPYCPY